MSEQNEDQASANLPATIETDRRGGMFRAGGAPQALIPIDWAGVARLANVAFQSRLAPKDLTSPQACAVAIMHGLEVGLKPMTALQRIAVINGRPSIWGDAALGLVEASGLLEDITETIIGEGEDQKAVCTVHRKGKRKPVSRDFSVADAKLANLWQRRGRNGEPTPWVTYPKRMLQMRARAFALRDVFPDVLGGLYIAEELQGGQESEAPPPAPDPGPAPEAKPVQIEAKPAEEQSVAGDASVDLPTLTDPAKTATDWIHLIGQNATEEEFKNFLTDNHIWEYLEASAFDRPTAAKLEQAINDMQAKFSANEPDEPAAIDPNAA